MKKKKKFYLIGIKGTGMAALANILFSLGYKVFGSDVKTFFITEKKLRLKKIKIFNFNKKNIRNLKKNTNVIIGNCFKDNNVETNELKNRKDLKIFNYYDFLSSLIKKYRSVAVSGTHGKTSTLIFLKYILSNSKKKNGYLIGNGTGYLKKNSKYFIFESCEYKNIFLNYNPKIAIITNIDLDHIDYFKNFNNYLKSFRKFAYNIKELLIIYGDNKIYKKINTNKKIKIWTYGFLKSNKIRAKNIITNNFITKFDVFLDNKKIYNFSLPIYGKHMILNFLAALSIGLYEKIKLKNIEKKLLNFKFLNRRLEIFRGEKNIYIDDYAHHPTEINYTLKTIKELYKNSNKKIIVIFKPHRKSRLYYFMNSFVSSLSIANKVFLLPFTSIDDNDEKKKININSLKKKILNCEIMKNNDNDIKKLSIYSPAIFVFLSSKNIYFIKKKLINYIEKKKYFIF